MRVNDTYVRGFLAGVVGGFASLVVNGGTRLMGLSKLMWLELMGLIILGRFPSTVGEYVFAWGIQMAFVGILGGIFALVLPVLSYEHLYFKGVSYGAAIWYVLFSLPHLLQFPDVTDIPLSTGLSSISAAIAWGATLAFALKWLDKHPTT